MVFTLILLLSPQTFLPGLASIRIALLTGAFAVLAHCWTRFAARRPFMRSTRELWLAAGLLAWAAATLPFSKWVGGSLQILLDLYLKALIIFWLISQTVTTLARLRTIAWGLSLMAAPLATTAVREFLSHSVVKGRIVGYDAPLTGNPNDLALMLSLILPLTAALFLVSRRPVVRGLLAALIILDAGAIVVTFSRGGFLALATILVLYLRTLHKRREWKWVIAVLVLAAASVPLLPSGYLNRLSTITNIDADPTGSAEQRWADTRVGLGYLVRHPLTGAGLGMNVLALNELRGASWHEVHNVYLQYGMDLGWPGLALFLLLLVNCIRNAADVHERCIRVRALHELATLAEAIRIALVAFAVAALFSPVAYNFYFYYFAGLAVALSAAHAAEARNVAPTAIPADAGDDGQRPARGSSLAPTASASGI